MSRPTSCPGGGQTPLGVRQAATLGTEVAECLRMGRPAMAYTLVEPVLAQRTPFPVLERIGQAVGAVPAPLVDPFLQHTAAAGTMGGWVVIGGALGARLDTDPSGAMAHCRRLVVVADVWYATDILGERVPGPALVGQFGTTLALLAGWRADPSRWVRRTVGVAVHYWAKRSRGAPELAGRALALLSFIEPMFSERHLDAVKGVGWGLKTLGKHYPGLVSEWLMEQTVVQRRSHRALKQRKALTYLSAEERARAAGGTPR